MTCVVVEDGEGNGSAHGSGEVHPNRGGSIIGIGGELTIKGVASEAYDIIDDIVADENVSANRGLGAHNDTCMSRGSAEGGRRGLRIGESGSEGEHRNDSVCGGWSGC